MRFFRNEALNSGECPMIKNIADVENIMYNGIIIRLFDVGIPCKNVSIA